MNSQNKKENWDFSFGLLKADNLKPSPEMVELVKKEIDGKITKKEILEILKAKYNNQKKD